MSDTPEKLREADLYYRLGSLQATMDGIARDVSRGGLQADEDRRKVESLVPNITSYIDTKVLPMIQAHDERLIALEKYQWKMAGALAFLAIAVPIILSLITGIS
jgi:hypothetical protein